jgi:hypothetical protein
VVVHVLALTLVTPLEAEAKLASGSGWATISKHDTLELARAGRETRGSASAIFGGQRARLLQAYVFVDVRVTTYLHQGKVPTSERPRRKKEGILKTRPYPKSSRALTLNWGRHPWLLFILLLCWLSFFWLPECGQTDQCKDAYV